MTDSLERLLREAKAFAWKQTALDPIRRRMPTFLPYANPENWTKGELVELIYQGSETADTLSLGVFRELIYRHGGRKLVRETGAGTRQEVVHGSYWLEPRVEAEPQPWPENEVQELRQRLVNLIEEWESEDG